MLGIVTVDIDGTMSKYSCCLTRHMMILTIEEKEWQCPSFIGVISSTFCTNFLEKKYLLIFYYQWVIQLSMSQSFSLSMNQWDIIKNYEYPKIQICWELVFFFLGGGDAPSPLQFRGSAPAWKREVNAIPIFKYKRPKKLYSEKVRNFIEKIWDILFS